MPGLSDEEFFNACIDQNIPQLAAKRIGLPTRDNLWAWELYFKLNSGLLTPPPHMVEPGKDYLLLDALGHFPRVSTTDVALIEFTPSPELGRIGKSEAMKLGRYLTKYYASTMPAEEIKRIAEKHRALHAPPALKFATTKEDIELCYEKGPSSCMTKGKGYIKTDTHPVHAYASPDIAVAYTEKAGRITARCVVRPDKKVYTGKIYGDTTALELLLKQSGFKPGSLVGARLRLVPTDKEFRQYHMPYLDGTAIYVKRTNSDEFVVATDNSREGIQCHSTSGIVSIFKPTDAKCTFCQKMTAEEEAVKDGLNRTICNNCITTKKLVFGTVMNHKGVELSLIVTKSMPVINGITYYDKAAAEAAGFRYVASLNSYYPIDDVVYSQLHHTYILKNQMIALREGTFTTFQDAKRHGFDIYVHPEKPSAERYTISDHNHPGYTKIAALAAEHHNSHPASLDTLAADFSKLFATPYQPTDPLVLSTFFGAATS